MWAPSTFLGVEVNRLSRETNDGDPYHPIPSQTGIGLRDTGGDDPLFHAEHTQNGTRSLTPVGELSGIYIGILNIYATLPQFVGTFISSVTFSMLEPGRSSDLSDDKHMWEDSKSLNATSVCLFIGGMGTLAAAHITRKLKTL